MPKISIIVPVYNVESYLSQCMDSILGQTFTDFEMICINDGSTDSSLSILEEYASKDKRIRLINKENEGYGRTMNRGLLEAKAPYIGIVESDDFVKREMYEKLYVAMTEQPVDIIKCNYYHYTVEEGEESAVSQEYMDDIYGKIFEPIERADVFLANSSIWAALYRRDFLLENHICFHESPGASFQDLSFQFKVLSSAKRMRIIPDALLYYRTDNVMSSVHASNKIYCISDEIHLIENYIKAQSKERQEKLWPYLTKRKFYDYRWNYNRLDSVFQFAFFEKMVAEFKEDFEAGRFEKVEWKQPQDKEQLEWILRDPQDYFMKTVKQYRDRRIERVDTLNGKLPKTGFYHMLQTEENIIIYGAGKIGQYVAECLKKQGIEMGKFLFAVTDEGSAETEIQGLLVKQIDAALEENCKSLVLLAVKGEKQLEMLNHLQDLQCKKILLVDGELLGYLN